MRKGALAGFAVDCDAPFGAGAVAQIQAHINGNGQLFGYIVQDKNDVEICRDPITWLQFRGPERCILCQ